LKPSLIPMMIKEKWVKDLMGISINNVKLTTKISNKKKISSEGDLIFTHYGISGPVVLEHSAYLSHYSNINEHNISIDLLPNCKAEDLDRVFQQGAKDNGNKLVKSILIDLFPKNFCSKLLS